MIYIEDINPMLLKFIYSLGLIILSFLLPLLVKPILMRNKSDHHKMLIEKLLRYLFLIVTFFFMLRLFNIDLKVILGAAGIFSVAIGFASQTSASNLISGIFLLLERPFKVGDTIIVGDLKGIVISMDLLSTRLRTFDNMMMRIPNESLMKSSLTNMTHFPIRRIDIKIPLDFDVDITMVEKELIAIVSDIIEVLDEPKPLFLIDGMNDHALIVQFSFWTRIENIATVKKQVFAKIVKQLALQNVSISLPKRVILNK